MKFYLSPKEKSYYYSTFNVLKTLTLYHNMQPPKIKAFIDKVIQCPLQDIAIPLSGFRWEYSKVIACYFGCMLFCSVLVLFSKF